MSDIAVKLESFLDLGTWQTCMVKLDLPQQGHAILGILHRMESEREIGGNLRIFDVELESLNHFIVQIGMGPNSFILTTPYFQGKNPHLYAFNTYSVVALVHCSMQLDKQVIYGPQTSFDFIAQLQAMYDFGKRLNAAVTRFVTGV